MSRSDRYPTRRDVLAAAGALGAASALRAPAALAQPKFLTEIPPKLLVKTRVQLLKLLRLITPQSRAQNPPRAAGASNPRAFPQPPGNARRDLFPVPC